VFGRTALDSGHQGCNAGRCHPREPVKALSAIWRRPGDDDGGRHPVGEQRRAGQGVWTAAGVAHHGETLDPQGIRDRGGIPG